jgi:hypothetical protein
MLSMLSFGASEPRGIFNAANYAAAYRDLVKTSRTLDGNAVRAHMTYRSDVEQLAGGAHFRYTGDALPIPTASQQKTIDRAREQQVKAVMRDYPDADERIVREALSSSGPMPEAIKASVDKEEKQPTAYSFAASLLAGAVREKELPIYTIHPNACPLALSNLDGTDICPVAGCGRPANEHRNWIDTERKRGRCQ